MDYNTFTSNLANLKAYMKTVSEIEERKEEILYILSGVHGISFDSIPVNGNPSVTEERKLDLIDEYNSLCQRQHAIQGMIVMIKDMLSKMPDDLQSMLTDKFVKGKTYETIGIKYGYSSFGIWNLMRRETEKFL